MFVVILDFIGFRMARKKARIFPVACWVEREGGCYYGNAYRGTHNELDLGHQFYHVFCGFNSPSRLKGIQVLLQLPD